MNARPLHIQFASFDEVPSFKGSSTHILAGLRQAVQRAHVELISLGRNPIPSRGNFVHRPLPISEPNVLRRGLQFRSRVASIFRRRPGDVIHFRSPWEGLAAVRSGVPCLFEVNGLPSVEMPYHYRTTENALKIFREWEAECLEKANRLLCPSQQIADFLCKNFSEKLKEKIIVLSNGYDLLPLHPERMRENIPEDPFRMIYLGTLSYWQGIEWALRGLRTFSGDWRLDIYAPPHRSHSKRIQRRIQRWGLGERVRLMEPLCRGEMYHTLPRYDLGLAPFPRTFRNSEQGCCPVKILDYLSHGLPVFTSRLSITEPFISEGKNGFFFEANSLLSFRARLEVLLRQVPDRKKLSPLVQASLQNIPTWDQYAEQLYAIYGNLSASR